MAPAPDYARVFMANSHIMQLSIPQACVIILRLTWLCSMLARCGSHIEKGLRRWIVIVAQSECVLSCLHSTLHLGRVNNGEKLLVLVMHKVTSCCSSKQKRVPCRVRPLIMDLLIDSHLELR